MLEKDMEDFRDWMEILINEHSALTDFKDSMEILIDNFKKDPTFESYRDLEEYVFMQVMRSFYTPEYDKSIYDLIVKK